jgi:pimeloyl-ACP methyl ester carboxylesterase
MSALWGWVRYPFYAGSSLFGLGSAALYYYQKYTMPLPKNALNGTNTTSSEIIYPRNIPPGARTDVPRPSQYGIEDHEELSIPTPDGETLSAFLLRPANKSQARPVTILAFHGNAGNIGHRLPIGRVLTNDVNCTVLMLEYRGYGLSTGTPNEEGLVIDAQTGLDYIRSRDDLKNNKVVVFGQSIGVEESRSWRRQGLDSREHFSEHCEDDPQRGAGGEVVDAFLPRVLAQRGDDAEDYESSCAVLEWAAG